MTERRSASPPSDKFIDRAVYADLPLSEQLAVGALADKIVSEKIFAAPIDGPDARYKARRAGEILKEETGLLGTNVAEMMSEYQQAGDDKKVEARKGMTRLTGAVALVMKGDEEMSALIPLGAEKINMALPEAWKGMARGILKKEIKDRKVRSVLEGLDRVRATVNEEEARYVRTMSRALERQIDKLDDLIMDGEGDVVEATMVVGFLSNELGKVEGLMVDDPVDVASRPDQTAPSQPDQTVPSQPAPDQQQGQTDIEALQEQYYREQVALSENVRKFSYDEWKKSLLDKEGNLSRSDNNLWALKAPDWLPGVDDAEWREILRVVDDFNLAVRQKREKGGSMGVDDIKKSILGQIELPERQLKWMYEHPELKMKEVFHQITSELFEPMEKSAEIHDGQLDENGDLVDPQRKTTIYVFKDGDRDYVGEAEAYRRNEGKYKGEVAQRLVTAGVFDSVESAEISVSLAMDVLEMGGQFELADTRRRIGYLTDNLRVVMRPETKLVPKLGKEIWGGPWGEYLTIIYGNDKEALKAEADRLGIVPELLSGSFLNRKVEAAGGEIDMGEAFYRGLDVDFGETTGDLYFKWRKDQVMAACDMWTYISGGKPLELRELRETDNVVSQWRNGLYNAVRTLRSNGASLLPVSLIEAAVGGSTGLWPFKGGPFLRISSKDMTTIDTDYMRVGNDAADLLGVSRDEKEHFLDFYGVRGRKMKDLRNGIADYMYERNPYVRDFRRKVSNLGGRKQKVIDWLKKDWTW